MAKTIRIPLGNKPFVSPYNSVGREVCKNLYIEYAGSGTAIAEYFAIRIPGYRRFTNWMATASSTRGLYASTTGRLFTVNSNKVSEINSEGAGVVIGTLNTTSAAVPVAMCDNGSELLIVDGRDGWIFDLTAEFPGSFTRITDESFPGVTSQIGPTHCVCLESYFFVNEPGTRRYWWSNPSYTADNDGTHWNGLNFGQKQGNADLLQAIIACQGQLWLFGATQTEAHYDTQDFASQLWAKYQGSEIRMGTVAKYSVCSFANSVFWLGADDKGTIAAWTNEGFNPKRISTRGIEQIMQTLGDLSGTLGFIYSMAGHTFYVLQLPGRTLVYDMATDAWHERTYLSPVTGEESAWKCKYSAFAFGWNLFGFRDGGGVVLLDQNDHYNRDPMNEEVSYVRWEKTSPITNEGGKLIAYFRAQPIFQQGVGLSENTAAGVGQNPKCLISWSNDSGNSYGNTHEVGMGKQGEYGFRSRLQLCGHGRNRVWKLSGSDPVLTILVALQVDAEVMNA